jgi:hypothetical protein
MNEAAQSWSLNMTAPLVPPAKEPPRPNPVPEWLYERHGLAYLTFVIQGIGEVAQHLRQHGVILTSAEPTEVRKGVLALDITRHNGTRCYTPLIGRVARAATIGRSVSYLHHGVHLSRKDHSVASVVL